MNAITPLGDLVAPFLSASATPIGGRVTLPPERLAALRAELPAAIAAARSFAADWRKRVAEIETAPTPFLAELASSKAIELLREAEEKVAAQHRPLVERQHLVDGDAVGLIAELIVVGVEILEELRDLRWQMMAFRAEKAPREPRGPMGLDAIRRAVEARRGQAQQ